MYSKIVVSTALLAVVASANPANWDHSPPSYTASVTANEAFSEGYLFLNQALPGSEAAVKAALFAEVEDELIVYNNLFTGALPAARAKALLSETRTALTTAQRAGRMVVPLEDLVLAPTEEELEILAAECAQLNRCSYREVRLPYTASLSKRCMSTAGRVLVGIFTVGLSEVAWHMTGC